MKVMRDADTDPESAAGAEVSEKWPRTFSIGTPVASATIWRSAWCTPCPTSAAPW